MGLIIHAIVTAIAIAVAAFFIPGLHWGLVDYGLGEPGRYLSLFFTAIVLGVLNAFIKPILVMISMPLTCATLGLFMFVINAVMVWLLGQFTQTLGFAVDGFIPALLGSIVISIVSFLISRVIH
jgi:putative membrane protein